MDEPSYTLLELMRHRTPPLIVEHTINKQRWIAAAFHFDGRSVIAWKNHPGSEVLTLLDRDERVWRFLAHLGAER